MRDDIIEGLFSLFTSSDRAEAMAGDLVEEREKRGWSWFWLHVVRVTLTLWSNAAAEAPLPVLALATTGCVLFAGPAFAGAAAIRLVPHLSGSPVSWITLSGVWWGGAFWIGASLVSIAPQRGMAACATLAATGAALLMALGDGILFSAIGLATTALLLLGGATAHRRTIAR